MLIRKTMSLNFFDGIQFGKEVIATIKIDLIEHENETYSIKVSKNDEKISEAFFLISQVSKSFEIECERYKNKLSAKNLLR